MGRRVLGAAGRFLATNILLIGGVAAVHELGHLLVGHLLSCGSIRIVPALSPYTAMRCPGAAPASTAVLGSLAPFVPVSGVVALRRVRGWDLAAIGLGIAVIAAATDLRILLGAGMEPLAAAIGAVVLFYGEVRFVQRLLHRTARSPPQDN